MANVKAKLQIGSVKYNCFVDESVFSQDPVVRVANGYMNVELTKMMAYNMGDNKKFPVRVSCCADCPAKKIVVLELENSSVKKVLDMLRRQNSRGDPHELQNLELELYSEAPLNISDDGEVTE